MHQFWHFFYSAVKPKYFYLILSSRRIIPSKVYVQEDENQNENALYQTLKKNVFFINHYLNFKMANTMNYHEFYENNCDRVSS